MDVQSYWSLVGVTFVVMAGVQLWPHLRYRYLISCVLWAFCALWVYGQTQNLDLLAVPVLAVVTLTALKLITPDQR